jgi:hypothetical protein
VLLVAEKQRMCGGLPSLTAGGVPGRSGCSSCYVDAWRKNSGRELEVVRAYYLNDADTERVARRARAIREAAGTLSGVALGEDDRREERDVRADLAAVAGTDNGLHWAEAAGRLAERFPGAVGRRHGRLGVRRGARPGHRQRRRPPFRWRGQGCPAPGRGLMSGVAVAGRAGMCSAGATAADQPERQAAATCSGRAPRLACDVAADAARP